MYLSPIRNIKSIAYWFSVPNHSHNFFASHGFYLTVREMTEHWPILSRISFTQRYLTHWGRVTHICVGNLNIIGSDKCLSPGRRQAITWSSVGISLIGPLGTNFSEMLIKFHTFSFKKIPLEMSSWTWRPLCNPICITEILACLYIT